MVIDTEGNRFGLQFRSSEWLFEERAKMNQNRCWGERSGRVSPCSPPLANQLFFLAGRPLPGRAIPRSLNRLHLSDTVLETHCGWDLGVAGLPKGYRAQLDAS